MGHKWRVVTQGGEAGPSVAAALMGRGHTFPAVNGRIFMTFMLHLFSVLVVNKLIAAAADVVMVWGPGQMVAVPHYRPLRPPALRKKTWGGRAPGV